MRQLAVQRVVSQVTAAILPRLAETATTSDNTYCKVLLVDDEL